MYISPLGGFGGPEGPIKFVICRLSYSSLAPNTSSNLYIFRHGCDSFCVYHAHRVGILKEVPTK